MNEELTFKRCLACMDDVKFDNIEFSPHRTTCIVTVSCESCNEVYELEYKLINILPDLTK